MRRRKRTSLRLLAARDKRDDGGVLPDERPRLRRSLERLRDDSDSLPSPSELDRHVLANHAAPAAPSGPLSESDLLRLRAENRNLKRLQEVIHFLADAADIDTLVPEIVGLGTSISGLSRGLLALLGNKAPNGDRSFKVRVVRGITREERADPEVRLLRKALASTLEDRRSYFEGDVRRSDLCRGERDAEGLALGSVVSLPLEADGELLGALLLDEPSRTAAFTRHEIELLQSFARHAALALARLGDRKRLARRSERLRSEREHLRQKFEETQHELDVLKTRSTRLSSASGRLVPSSGSRERDRMDEFLGRSYLSAKRSFLRHYLREAIERTGGDLERAARATGLSVSKLVKLLEIHQVPPMLRPLRAASSASAYDRGDR